MPKKMEEMKEPASYYKMPMRKEEKKEMRAHMVKGSAAAKAHMAALRAMKKK